jgi:hypothetical protein
VINWSTISSLATAGGTLVLGVATFAAVRSANRAARVAERSFEIGLRPVLAPSRLEDPPQRLMYSDRHWVTLKGGRAVVEEIEGIIYLAMLVRNVGSGMGLIEAWEPRPGQVNIQDGWGAVEDFRRQSRDLWVPPGDVAFWQGALRDKDEAIYPSISESVQAGALTVELLYLDHEGGQRSVSRFSFVRRDDEGEAGDQEWWASLSSHRTLGPA